MFVRRPLGDARSRSLEAGEPIAEAIFVKIALTVTEAALTPIKETSGPAAYPDMAMIRLFLAGDVIDRTADRTDPSPPGRISDIGVYVTVRGAVAVAG